MCRNARDLIVPAGTDYDFRQLTFVGIADHAAYSRKRCNFFRRSLCVTSGDDDLAARVLTTDAADRSSRVLICRGGDSACIQYNDFRLRDYGSSRQAAFLELALDGSAIGLRSPATEILHVETRHGSIVTRFKQNGVCPGRPEEE
jgi:hypothetical protein